MAGEQESRRFPSALSSRAARMWRSICAGALFLALATAAVATHSPYLLQEPVFQPENFSVTSLRFNERAILPRWVDHLLGNKAIFWKLPAEEKPRKALSSAEDGRLLIQNASVMSVTAFTPECSMELLGFVKISSQEPFVKSFKHSKPSMGRGRLSMGSLDWRCYYRATYDNWRLSEVLSEAPHYWPVFVYCPAPWTAKYENSQCEKLQIMMEDKESLPVKLIVETHRSKWTVPLSLVHNSFKPHENAIGDTAMCTSMPYVSAIESKRNVVGAIFFEWLRYHTNLGYNVVVYDATGRQHQHIFESVYARRQRMSLQTLQSMRSRLSYFGYSILGRLDPRLLELTYDNDEVDVPAISRMDDDHTMSLTHCRFDVAARWGVRHVLVTDFDEFVYCPAAAPQAKAQAQFFHRYVRSAVHRNLDQVLLFQDVVYNRTEEGAAECIRRQIADAEKEMTDGGVSAPSVFSCFAGHSFRHASILHKALHTTDACPFNTDHHACSSANNMDWTDYDCVCNTQISSQCALVHLSIRANEQQSHGNEVDRAARESELEITNIARSEPVTWKSPGRVPDI